MQDSILFHNISATSRELYGSCTITRIFFGIFPIIGGCGSLSCWLIQQILLLGIVFSILFAHIFWWTYKIIIMTWTANTTTTIFSRRRFILTSQVFLILCPLSTDSRGLRAETVHSMYDVCGLVHTYSSTYWRTVHPVGR